MHTSLCLVHLADLLWQSLHPWLKEKKHQQMSATTQRLHWLHPRRVTSGTKIHQKGWKRWHLWQFSQNTSFLPHLHMVAERKLHHHHDHNRRRRKVPRTRIRNLRRRQQHQHQIQVCNAITTLVPHNTTTTTTTGARPVTSKVTSRRRRTSWPLVFTSTTSTSRMESATCSSYHSHIYQNLQSSMVFHLHSQNGLVNSDLASTSANLSTSTSWTSHTTQNNLLLQTSWFSRHQLDIDNVRRHSVYDKHVRIKFSPGVTLLRAYVIVSCFWGPWQTTGKDSSTQTNQQMYGTLAQTTSMSTEYRWVFRAQETETQ